MGYKTYESDLAEWELRDAKLRAEIVSRAIRLTDNRPQTSADHPNLTRIYQAVRDLMGHAHERPKYPNTIGRTSGGVPTTVVGDPID